MPRFSKRMALLLLGFAWLAPLLASQDVLTWHNDNARTGQDLHEKLLTPANVNPATFGKLFVIHVDGKVDAEPLYVEQVAIPNRGRHNVLVIATEHDSLYAFDADTGAQLWRVSLLKPGETPSDRRNCSQVEPEIGITATPVIDLHRGPHGVIYAVAMSKDAQGQYAQRLHALDLETGSEALGGPVEIHATYPGHGAASQAGVEVFDPKQYEERPALLLLNGVIYTTWASHCDIAPYNGWIIGYNGRTLQQTGVVNFTPNGEDGAVWQAGAGPAADPQGNFYLLAANGTFDTNLDAHGFPAQGDYGNAFLKISVRHGRPAIADYFAMYNVVAENATDGDLGSGGPMVLPDVRDVTGEVRHLAVGAGKDRNIYLVDRDSMGRFDPRGNQNIYQELPGALQGGHLHGPRGAPAYFNGRIYYGPLGQSIVEFRIRNARLEAQPASRTTTMFVYPGATPSISADGNRNGIVWAAENTPLAALHAYDANDLSHELYNSNEAPNGRDQFGRGNKFITPLIAHGKVYVGTQDGVGVFGLLNHNNSAAAGAP